MGVLGKDLFDINRPRTHVKVQFGQSAYWVESELTPHPYGEVLTELLNYDLAPYEYTLSILEQTIDAKDTQAAPRAFMDAVRDLASFHIFACSCPTCESSTICLWKILWSARLAQRLKSISSPMGKRI